MRKKILSMVLTTGLLLGSVIHTGQLVQVKAAGIEINEENFGKDESLLAQIRCWDLNHDDILSDAEAAYLSSLWFYEPISDVTPIVKYFPKLNSVGVNVGNADSLTINSKSVKEISITAKKAVHLKGSNSITKIFYTMSDKKGKVDFTKMKGYEKVKEFSIFGEGLTGVVAPNKAKLTTLKISRTKIDKIDTAQYKKVTCLDLSGNQLKSINVKKNKSLTSLACYNNKLKTLNITANTALKDIGAGGNKLGQINVAKNKKLKRIVVYDNQLKKMQLSSNKNLEQLLVGNNKLTKLDLTKNSKLIILDVDTNKIKEIKFSKKDKVLSTLNVKGTKIKKLDLPKGAKISSAYVGDRYCAFKNMKFATKGYVSIGMSLPANKSYQLPKLVPALKGYKFESLSEEKITVNEKTGKFKMPKLKEREMVSLRAVKGDKSTYVNLFPMNA